MGVLASGEMDILFDIGVVGAMGRHVKLAFYGKLLVLTLGPIFYRDL